MKKRLIVTPDLCIGCRTCEISCAFAHAREPGRPGQSRVRVYPRGEQAGMPVLCLQCEEAACMAVCPVGALVRNEATGAVEYLPQRCIHCKACVAACPFGNIAYEEATDHMIKCDLCGGDPTCARFCPSSALTFADSDAEANLARRRKRVTAA